MRIQIRDLHLSYEVRVIGETSWLRQLFRADYRMKPVLKGLSLEVADRGVVSILGKNGSGKTTLIKTMAGLLRPTQGEVRILGHEPWRHEAKFLSRIGAVFGQKRMLWPELSLSENFNLLGAIYRVPEGEVRKRVADLTELFNLGSISNRPVKTLSLGESMRAEVACSLLHRPNVLFLDEPTVGMDIKSQNKMRLALKEYVANHDCLVILTSHNTQDIVSLSNQILLLNDGRLEEMNDITGDTRTRIEKIEMRLVNS